MRVVLISHGQQLVLNFDGDEPQAEGMVPVYVAKDWEGGGG